MTLILAYDPQSLGKRFLSKFVDDFKGLYFPDNFIHKALYTLDLSPKHNK